MVTPRPAIADPQAVPNFLRVSVRVFEVVLPVVRAQRALFLS